MGKNRPMTFEESLEELETIVHKLETGNLPLESSIDEFEKGIIHYKNCKKQLDTYEKKIVKLTNDLKEENFE